MIKRSKSQKTAKGLKHETVRNIKVLIILNPTRNQCNYINKVHYTYVLTTAKQIRKTILNHPKLDHNTILS
jgi:hypothetical protein